MLYEILYAYMICLYYYLVLVNYTYDTRLMIYGRVCILKQIFPPIRLDSLHCFPCFAICK